MFKHSIEYAQKGWYVFPIIPGIKKPATEHGFKDATRELAAINYWIAQNPKFNIGIATGQISGITVVDVDVKNGHAGKESLKKLNLPPTLTVRTPTGGWHLYYRYEPTIKSGIGVLDGIDIKTDGGYIVAPPSVIKEGEYEWVNLDHEIAVLGPAAIDSLRSARKAGPSTSSGKAPGALIGEYRNNHLTSIAGAMRRKGMTAEEILHSIVKVNEERCSPALEIKEVEGIAKSVGSYPVVITEAPNHTEMSALWETMGITRASNGSPIPNLDNAAKVLESYQDYKDLVWFDEFYQKIFTTWNSSRPREWSDADDLAMTLAFQRDFGFSRMSVETVGQAIRNVARMHVKNEPRDWMNTLEWDKVERVEHFFVDALGATANHYSQQISHNFWVSIAARVFNPGCQMDNMVVLEGAQGIGKSQALRAIGGKWYTEANESVTSKDFFMILPGKLIVEIAELDSFNRAEVTRIKQVISCGVDRYRAPYARHSQDYPRMSVFVGSTNEKEYLKDNTGARRFWPIECAEINHSYISRYRDQLFAEAVHLFQTGSHWWEVPEEVTKAVQEDRRNIDPWEEIIYDHLIGKAETCFQDIASGPLKLAAERQDKRIQMRVSNILRQLGWARQTGWDHTTSKMKKTWIPKTL